TFFNIFSDIAPVPYSLLFEAKLDSRAKPSNSCLSSELLDDRSTCADRINCHHWTAYLSYLSSMNTMNLMLLFLRLCFPGNG
ncbi:unnamed protein product, partial [Musa hybrid cultivar]